MPAMADRPSWDVKSRDREVIVATASIAIGAAGAPTLTGNEGMSIAGPGGGGAYTLTYPVCVDARVMIYMAVTATIKGVVGTAFAPTSGTHSFETQDAAGTAANPGNGDVLHVFVWAKASVAI